MGSLRAVLFLSCCIRQRSVYGLFGVMNLYPSLPGERGIMGGNVTGVVWHGTRCRSRADELTSRNMCNNNDRNPADRFSNITPHDPQSMYPIQRWEHYSQKKRVMDCSSQSLVAAVLHFCLSHPQIVILLSGNLSVFMCD